MKNLNFYLWDVLEILSKKHRFKLIIFTLLFLFATLLETIGIGFIIPVIEAISNFDNFKSKINDLDIIEINNFDKEFIIKIIIGLLLIIYSVKNIFLTILSYLQFKFLKEVKFELGNIAFNVYLKKNFIHHLNLNSSKIIRNINDTTFAVEAVKNLMIIISELFVVIGISIFLFFYQPLSTLISLILMIFFLLIFQIFFHKKSKTYGEGRFLSEEKKLKFIKDIFGSIKDIKIKNKESFFLKKFNDVNKMLTSFEMKQGFLSSLPRFWLEWTTILVMVTLIFYFINQSFEVEKYFVILGVFAAAAFRLMPSFSRIISALQRMKFIYPVLQEYKKIVSNNENLDFIRSEEYKKDLIFKKNITLKNVTFYYNDNERKIFKNINFKINKGEVIGITGESGSGKSTLISILTGLLRPVSGSVLIDDNDIFDNKLLKNWQKKIGYVPQNIFIHDSSVVENIAFGVAKNSINTLKIISLLENMKLNDLARDVKNNNHVNLGEYGDRISGGQKQRLGIARALYQNPEVLILDESTSALDISNEEKIINDIMKLRNNVTIIIVSHRESTIKNCDRIFSIKNLNKTGVIK